MERPEEKDAVVKPRDNMIPRGTAIQVGEHTTGSVRLTVYWRRGWRLDRALVVVRELSRMEYVPLPYNRDSFLLDEHGQIFRGVGSYDSRPNAPWEEPKHF